MAYDFITRVYSFGVEATGRLRSSPAPGPKKPGGAQRVQTHRRGRITCFSKESRRRMRRRLMSVPWGKFLGRGRVGWLTLTFAGSPSLAEAKRAFQVWGLRFRRRFPGAGLFWRMEFQKRGVAHFHILVVFPQIPNAFLDWCTKNWGEITGSPVQAVHFRWVSSWRGLLTYMVDASKTGQSSPPARESFTGRWWGYWLMDEYFESPREFYGYELWERVRQEITKVCFERLIQRGRAPPPVLLSQAFLEDPDAFISRFLPEDGSALIPAWRRRIVVERGPSFRPRPVRLWEVMEWRGERWPR